MHRCGAEGVLFCPASFLWIMKSSQLITALLEKIPVCGVYSMFEAGEGKATELRS